MKTFVVCLCAFVIFMALIMTFLSVGIPFLGSWPVMAIIGICALVVVGAQNFQ